MSLDVYLKAKDGDVCGECGGTGKTHEILYGANITHNLNKMAAEAGIYEACWRPEEIGAKQAKDITPILEKGLELLKSKPEYFEKFNPSNGWGSYDDFADWVEGYLEACRENPEALIKVSR